MGIPSTLLEAARGRKPRDLKKEVLDCLQRYAAGHENAKTSKQITGVLLFNGPPRIDDRIIREFIRKLRMEGKLIVSGGQGYWIPVGPEDRKPAREYIDDNIMKRAKMIMSLARPQMLAYEKWSGEQLEFEGINI